MEVCCASHVIIYMTVCQSTQWSSLKYHGGLLPFGWGRVLDVSIEPDEPRDMAHKRCMGICSHMWCRCHKRHRIARDSQKCLYIMKLALHDAIKMSAEMWGPAAVPILLYPQCDLQTPRRQALEVRQRNCCKKGRNRSCRNQFSLLYLRLRPAAYSATRIML